ncbi:ANTAR domain-containing response regulator [Ammoniphilus sp. CFH 90114]|uniref:ANTAR domain-containing response regulator n=1 Tax=Ammoniphilus sp. CFH 90114 TaxID=2493665 RepID=UPI00100FFC7B|nr:ANTAR domain-containing protein [Ammoniphilus sp. CFH 90114]RXT05755.1 ANTAR domain-containing protein [Ammoniphilus sp. CFH 90114]
MIQINLCLSEQQFHEELGKELKTLGYRVVDNLNAEQNVSHISIVDQKVLEEFPSKFNYPILYTEQMAEETIKVVDLYTCSGIIDASCTGYLLKGVVEVCWARKKEREQLMKENQKLNAKLQDRRIIEKAKFVLMKRHRTSEEEAYRKMRSKAMREQKSLREIADLILLHEE